VAGCDLECVAFIWFSFLWPIIGTMFIYVLRIKYIKNDFGYICLSILLGYLAMYLISTLITFPAISWFETKYVIDHASLLGKIVAWVQFAILGAPSFGVSLVLLKYFRVKNV